MALISGQYKIILGNQEGRGIWFGPVYVLVILLLDSGLALSLDMMEEHAFCVSQDSGLAFSRYDGGACVLRIAAGVHPHHTSRVVLPASTGC